MLADLSEKHKDFIKMLRKHIITIIKRDEKDGRGYYDLVWESQTVEELLEYKMMRVHK